MEFDELTLNLEKELCNLIIKKKSIHFRKTKLGFVLKNNTRLSKNSRYNECWKRIVEFTNKYIMCQYNAVKVIYQNPDVVNEEHVFFGNGYATAVSLGNYKEGFMVIDDLTFDCKYEPHLFNLTNFKLQTVSSGFRFFILFYKV